MIPLATSYAELDPADRRDRELDSELLDAELPDARFRDGTYLHWLYDRNPFGPGFHRHRDSDGVRIAHYALTPQRYRSPEGLAPFVFSLNAVVRSGGHRKGIFTGLCNEVWGAAADAGIQTIIGVTNTRSLKPTVRLGFRCVGPMPVRVALPGPARPRGWESYAVDEPFLGSPTFEELGTGLDRVPVWTWTNDYSLEYLRWRLASPTKAPYAIHADDTMIAVSTVQHVGGVPVALLLKLLPRAGRFGPLDASEAVAQVCRFHRAPAAVYAGWNRHVRVRGVPVPERARPVPLNLMFLSLVPEIRHDILTLDTYEFLDADAY